jgi:hypothetical protein
MMNGSVGLQQQPFISPLSTANSNNYQPASVSAPVMSNGTEEEPEAKIPKHEVLELTFKLVHLVGLWLFKNVVSIIDD